MDKDTVEAYNNNSKAFAERHRKQTPERLYQLALTFFKKEAPTLDLGCGIGRDTHWLNINGFKVIGVDPSEGMLNIAQETYPDLQFQIQSLPHLNFEENSFDNIFCCAVLMHIPRSDLVNSVVNLLKITKPSGRLIISFRDGNGESDGRRFETYHLGQVAQLFESLGGKVLYEEQEGIWKTLVIEKSDINKREGIAKIQEIITRDKKTATYKFALLRALCEISRYESHSVTWYRDGDLVLVPMKRIAFRWVLYYWPLVKEGVKQTTSNRMAFEGLLSELPHELSDISILKNDLENPSNKDMNKLLKKVSDTIHKGPVTYAGGGDSPVFSFVSALDASVYPELKDKEYGTVAVPISLWRDINLFSHWIEDSLAIQWAELTEKINKDGRFGHHLDLITKSVQEDERSTYIIRKLFQGKEVECVWTGKKIKQFEIDHMIPWAIWRNNDLWNLLPTDPKVNGNKRDFLPSPQLIRKRFDSIKHYWEVYVEKHEDLFKKQVERSLGLELKDAFKSQGIEALEQSLTRVNVHQGGVYWNFG